MSESLLQLLRVRTSVSVALAHVQTNPFRFEIGLWENRRALAEVCDKTVPQIS